MAKKKPSQTKEVAKTGMKEISLLVNAAYYFIQCVYIIRLHAGYRLVAIHQGKVLINRIYRTLRGAHIAFSKKFNCRAWKKEIKADWTDFYYPELNWLNGKAA